MKIKILNHNGIMIYRENNLHILCGLFWTNFKIPRETIVPVLDIKKINQIIADYKSIRDIKS